MQNQTLPIEIETGVFRCACLSDVRPIVEMVGELAAHHGDEATLTSEGLIRDAFGPAPWVHVLVAEVGGDLVGYAVLCGLTQLHFGRRGLDMHHLFTKAPSRGRGIGQSLVEACKIRAKELSCDYMTVSTHPDNTKAQDFYLSAGFERRTSGAPRFAIRL